VCVTLYLACRVLTQDLMPGFLRIGQLADLQLEDRSQPPPKDGCLCGELSLIRDLRDQLKKAQQEVKEIIAHVDVSCLKALTGHRGRAISSQ
jgi:hypothetical protein